MRTQLEDASSTGVLSKLHPIHVYQFLGVALPLVVLTLMLSQRPLSFDGAMNMQVAQSLAHDGLFSRYYGGDKVFPSEIQTSSYFLLIAAGAIRIFGSSALSLQASNIIFAAILLGAISTVVPRRPLAKLLVPATVLIISPGLIQYSSGGYGEGAVAALALCAFIFLARAAVEHQMHRRRIVYAALCVGTAISIKTVAAAILPVAAAMLVLVWITHGRKGSTLMAGAAVGIPLLLFEAFRAVSLGDQYDDWWAYHFMRVNVQATGAGLDDPSKSIFSKIADHFHLLSIYTRVPAEVWLVFFVILPLIVAAMFFVLRDFLRKDSVRFQMILCAQLTAYGLIYAAWWLAVTSTEKAWLRRIAIGLFVLILAAVLLALTVATQLSRGHARPLARTRRAALIAWLPVTLLLVFASAPIVSGARSPLSGEGDVASIADLSDTVANKAAAGARFYGIGWWSAPVISLYSGVGMENLSQTDYCAGETLAEIRSGDAYLIWDSYAQNLWSPEPDPFREVVYERTGVSTPAGELWRITLPAGACPA